MAVLLGLLQGNNKFDLFKELVKARFKLRYNNSLLGFVWVLMKPFISFMILYFIFTAFRGGSHDSAFAANLFIGLIAYTFFQEGVVFGMNSLLDMSNIILKINFPREIAISSSVFMAVINFSINFVVIMAITLILGFKPSIMGFAYFSYIILLFASIIYGISLFLSVILIRVRDLTNIIELVFQLLFWASGIFYNIDEIQGNTGALIRMNPIAILIDAARKAFIFGRIEHVTGILIISGATLILLILGYFYFKKNVRKVAEYF